jgi:ribosomal protein S27AE
MPRRGPPNSIRNAKRWYKRQSIVAVLRARDKGRHWQRCKLLEDARTKHAGETFCAVDEVKAGVVYATLYDDGVPTEVVEICLMRFPVEDRATIRAGTIFYVGKDGIRVERRKWTREEIYAARAEGRRLFEQLNRMEEEGGLQFESCPKCGGEDLADDNLTYVCKSCGYVKITT